MRFADVALTPVTYEEADDADCLHVSLTAVITPELRDRLFALKRGRGYFSVIRVGVNEAPEEMRLGRLLWSREGDLVRAGGQPGRPPVGRGTRRTAEWTCADA